jgi:AMMECR1 domain-containing protein
LEITAQIRYIYLHCSLPAPGIAGRSGQAQPTPRGGNLKTTFMFIPRSFHTSVALDCLIHYFRTGKRYVLPDEDLPETFLEPGACFVSILDGSGAMKSCMGTIEPITKNLFTEIVQNCLHAAFEDARAAKLKESELKEISITVETVEKPEKIDSLSELDPALFGIIVQTRNNQKGVLLPNCEGVDTAEKQVMVALKKGGIQASSETELKNLNLFRFRVIKHL